MELQTILFRYLITNAIETEMLILSPLIMIEFVFVLTKLGCFVEKQDIINFFQEYVQGTITPQIVKEAIQICNKLSNAKNINDLIHLKFAESYAQKIITFDHDFNQLRKFTCIEIELLN